jgi:hypothetical protein
MGQTLRESSLQLQAVCIREALSKFRHKISRLLESFWGPNFDMDSFKTFEESFVATVVLLNLGLANWFELPQETVCYALKPRMCDQ